MNEMQTRTVNPVAMESRTHNAYGRRLEKWMKERVACNVARTWVQSAALMIGEGKNPARLSASVRDDIASEIDAQLGETADNYYIPSVTLTKLAKSTIREALSLLQLPRYEAVKRHFTQPVNKEGAATA